MYFDTEPQAGRSVVRRPLRLRLAAAALASAVLLPFLAGCGDDNSNPPDDDSGILTAVTEWNQVAIDASGLDHTPLQAGETRVFGEQFGPCRASRALAIVQISVFEAVNAIEGGYESYVGLAPAPRRDEVQAAGFAPTHAADAIPEVAVGRAAHDALVAMFPSQKPALDAKLTEFLAGFPDGHGKTEAISIGCNAAAAAVGNRQGDGSERAEPTVDVDFICNQNPGYWRKDPISQRTVAMGAYWDQVRPFALTSAAQFRVPAFPAMTSAEYTEAYNEVKSVGGDGVNTATTRTADQTIAANYWAYDGTPSLCAPPRLYNQIAVHIAEQMHSDGVETARLLALVNVAMADAGIAIWESKYHYQVWRPVCGIRESDSGGPTGLGDGNANTVGDPDFHPLGAPLSNGNGPNFTPPFPSYPSGHAGFGGALFETLRDFYGTDAIAFTFVSDEYNGVTKDASGAVRPLTPRTFANLSRAEDENGQSRIYLGIHWAMDKTAGIAQGRCVADWVFNHVFRPVGS